MNDKYSDFIHASNTETEGVVHMIIPELEKTRLLFAPKSQIIKFEPEENQRTISVLG